MLVVSLFCGVKPNQNKTDGWIPLFNGKDLDGWKHVGDGTHFVENGCISSTGGMGLLVCKSTEKMMSFILKNCLIKI